MHARSRVVNMTFKVMGYCKILDACVPWQTVMITRYCIMFYLHENQRCMSFTKRINGECIISFKQLLVKNLTVQA